LAGILETKKEQMHLELEQMVVVLMDHLIGQIILVCFW
jgi:hypothetical protein